MNLHLFQAVDDRTIYAFTDDPTGQNLPDALAPWEKIGNAMLIQTSCILAGFGSSEDVIHAVKRDGYVLKRPGPNVINGGKQSYNQGHSK